MILDCLIYQKIQRKFQKSQRNILQTTFIEIKKEWSCEKTQSDGQVSKGAKCSLTCTNGYQLSNSIFSVFFDYLIVTLDRKTYIRRCQKGGKWSQSKASIACEKDGTIINFT